MPVCVYCGKAKGKRKCPALELYSEHRDKQETSSVHICSRCCGENRVINIDCPPTCRYLKEHEVYQQEKLGEDFRNAWLESTKELYKQGKEEVLSFMIFLEIIIYRYYRDETKGNDDDILEGLEFTKRQLSPIEIVGVAGSSLGEYIWDEVQAYLEMKGLEREKAVEGVEATIEFLKAYSGKDQVIGTKRPRRYLQGLLGHVEKDFDLPKEPEEEPGLIITPDELRQAHLP